MTFTAPEMTFTAAEMTYAIKIIIRNNNYPQRWVMGIADKG